MSRISFNHKQDVMDEFFKRVVNFGWMSPDKAELYKKAENNVTERSSEYKKNIEGLYGIKLDLNDDQKLDPIDQAHPNTPHTVLKTYDLINGMVPNEKQKHDINSDLATNMPNGMHTNKRYIKAYEDLAKELVAIGFSTDNQNQEELRILADNCLEQLSKKAFIPWVIGGLAVGLGWIAAMNNMAYSDQGVINDAIRAVTEIEEAKTSVPSLVGDLIKLQGALNYLISLGTKVNTLATSPSNEQRDVSSIVDDLKSGVGVETAQKAKGISEFLDTNAGKEKIKLIQRYKKACEKLSNYLPSYITALKTSGSVAQQESSNRWFAPFSKAVEYIWPPAVEDAWKALETLQSSLLKLASQIDAHAESVKQLIETNKHDLVKEMGGEIPEELDLEEKPEQKKE